MRHKKFIHLPAWPQVEGTYCPIVRTFFPACSVVIFGSGRNNADWIRSVGGDGAGSATGLGVMTSIFLTPNENEKKPETPRIRLRQRGKRFEHIDIMHVRHSGRLLSPFVTRSP